MPPISKFDSVLGVCWGIPRNVNSRKSKNGKWFYVIDLIDSNNKITKVRCWGIDKEKDIIYLNRPYVLKPKYTDSWGFSTYGSVDKSWGLLA